MSVLFAQERRRQILTALEKQGSVRVAELAARLAVTEETVRRDLERLGRDGKLRRIHGGALPIDEERRDLPFDIRKTTNLGQKELIGKEAARHVAEGDVIAIDASSTAYEMVLALPDIPITVITPSIPVVTALAQRGRIKVICTGGRLDTPSMSFSGPVAEQALQRFNIHKAFVSCKGLDVERGLSETSESQGTLKQKMVDLAGRSFLLVDKSKLGVRSVVFFAEIEEIDLIVTDRQSDVALIQRLRAAGRKVLCAAN